MTRIFFSKKYGVAGDRRAIFALSSMEVHGPIKYRAIYNHPKGYVIHLKAGRSGDLAIFFQGFALEAVEEITSEIARSEYIADSRSSRGSSRFFVAKAALILAAGVRTQAAELSQVPALCGGAVSQPGLGQANSASLFRKVWECTKGLGGGTWDATGGGAWFVAKGAYSTVMHPIDTFNQASEGFSKAQAMMTDIRGAFGNLKSSFDGLPDDVKWHLGCEIVSSVGTTAVIAYLTVGGGSPLLLRTVAQALAKVGAVLPNGSAAAAKTLALAAKMASKADEAKLIEALVAEGRGGAQFVGLVEKFKDVLSGVWHAQNNLELANYNALVNVKNANLGVVYANTTKEALFARGAADVKRASERLAERNKTLESLQQQYVAFSDAVTKALKGEGTYHLNYAAVQEDVLRELAARSGKTVSPSQVAAVSAYLGVQGCNTTSIVNGTLNSGATGRASEAAP